MQIGNSFVIDTWLRNLSVWFFYSCDWIDREFIAHTLNISELLRVEWQTIGQVLDMNHHHFKLHKTIDLTWILNLTRLTYIFFTAHLAVKFNLSPWTEISRIFFAIEDLYGFYVFSNVHSELKDEPIYCIISVLFTSSLECSPQLATSYKNAVNRCSYFTSLYVISNITAL